MNTGELLLVIGLNCFIFAGFQFVQSRVIEKRLRNLKNEIQELEDLVAAIMEEFEEVATSQTASSQVTSSQTMSSLETGPVTQTEFPQTTLLIPDDQPETVSIPAADVSSLEYRGESEPFPRLPQPEPEANPRPHNPAHFQPVDPRHIKILELWTGGAPIEEIARKLNTGKGEVQLVLGLYHKI